jgi:tRNA-Thr(GGU) m(6)t(6)A37 methyltransferase TsaA
MSKNRMNLNPIGKTKIDEQNGRFELEISEKFRKGLLELDSYTHITVIWWVHKNDNPKARNNIVVREFPPFYGENVPNMGVFATRSEFRPNPILFSTAQIVDIDHNEGLIKINYLDALNESPILDIKPYIPMSDRHITAKNPNFLQHWPDSNEEAVEWWAKMMEDHE